MVSARRPVASIRAVTRAFCALRFSRRRSAVTRSVSSSASEWPYSTLRLSACRRRSASRNRAAASASRSASVAALVSRGLRATIRPAISAARRASATAGMARSTIVVWAVSTSLRIHHPTPPEASDSTAIPAKARNSLVAMPNFIEATPVRTRKSRRSRAADADSLALAMKIGEICALCRESSPYRDSVGAMARLVGLRVAAALAGMALAIGAGAEEPVWELETWEVPYDYTSRSRPVRYEPLERATRKWRICASYPHLKDSYWLSVNYGMVLEAETARGGAPGGGSGGVSQPRPSDRPGKGLYRRGDRHPGGWDRELRGPDPDGARDRPAHAGDGGRERHRGPRHQRQDRGVLDHHGKQHRGVPGAPAPQGVGAGQGGLVPRPQRVGLGAVRRSRIPRSPRGELGGDCRHQVRGHRERDPAHPARRGPRGTARRGLHRRQRGDGGGGGERASRTRMAGPRSGSLPTTSPTRSTAASSAGAYRLRPRTFRSSRVAWASSRRCACSKAGSTSFTSGRRYDSWISTTWTSSAPGRPSPRPRSPRGSSSNRAPEVGSSAAGQFTTGLRSDNGVGARLPVSDPARSAVPETSS